MGNHFVKAWPEFDRAAFVAAAAKNLRSLELKQRSAQITSAMAPSLPDDYERAAERMLESLAPDDGGDTGGAETGCQGIAGWAIMLMTHYAGLYELGYFDLSMKLFKEMTKLFSSELAFVSF